MSYPHYPSYKDSGVPSLGKVPAHWQIKALKYIASYNDDVLTENTPQDYEIAYVDISNVDEVIGIINTEELIFKDAPSRARRRVCHGDVIISTVRTYLKTVTGIENPPDNLIVSTGFAVVRPKPGLHPGFASYLLHSQYFLDEVVARSKGVSYPAINASELVGIPVAQPPPDEQRAIATFLEREMREIDALIKKQQILITLLQEKRQAFISHTVTNGLDLTTSTKRSGIDWLDEIPSHWKVTPVKYLFSLIVDPAPKNNDYDLLSLYTEIGVRPRKELEERGNKASTTDGYLCVQEGDIIVNKLLAWMGAIGVSEYSGVTSPAYDVLRPKSNVDSHYYDLLFRCGICLPEFRKHSRGIMDMRLRLYFDRFGVIKMPCPPLGEQKQIVEYVKEQEARINVLEERCREMVEILQQRRTALISAAVTGQIDVRNS